MQPPFIKLSRRNIYRIFVGTSAISLGIILLLKKMWILEYVIASTLVLAPDSQIVNDWKKMPMELPTDIYFFNWSNPEDFNNRSIKPKFEQVGPYRFMQNLEKVNVVWNDNNTVTFNQMRYWRFDEEHTTRILSDKITSINAITLGASHYIRHWNYVIKRGASILFATIAPHVHITRTVNQLLFEGYEDLIVDIARYLPFLASEAPRFDRFGWFRIMNGSDTFEGVFNMANGIDGSFEILNWNYDNVTPYFNSSCAKVHGSAGELYSAKPNKDHIGIFLSHLCRYLRFDFEKEVVVDGILGYKYSIGSGVLDNGTLVPGNECFCAGDCLPSGMINVSSCRYGSPTYASLPNFYSADPVYLDAVDGLQPKKSEHEAYVVLEPNSALLLEAVLRLQLNILVKPVEGVTIFENVRQMFFPLLWIEQKAALPDHALSALKMFLKLPDVVAGLAIILIALGLYLLMCVVCRPVFVSLSSRICKKNVRGKLKAEEVAVQMDTCQKEKTEQNTVTDINK